MLLCSMWLPCFALAQEDSLKLFSQLETSARKTQHLLEKTTHRNLQRLMRIEQRLQRKFSRKEDVKTMYDSLAKRLNEKASGSVLKNVYSSKLDSLKTAIRFLQGKGDQHSKLLDEYNTLQHQFNETADISKFLRERQQYLLDNMPGLEKLRMFRKFRKEADYYKAALASYKEMWEDPSKLEAKLTGMLAQLPAFREFFGQQSDLASVFQLPGNSNVTNAANLQTRNSLNEFIMQNLGSNGNVQQQITPVMAQMNEMATLPKFSRDSSFKPHKQRYRSFLQRLEYNTNIQSARSDNFFPATTDVGLGVGYRLNDKSTIGLGASGKIGWGNGFSNIRVTGEGLSLRSFADIKLKGKIWISGAWEYNYQQTFSNVRMLHEWNAWRTSAMLGVTRKIEINHPRLKNYEIKLFYDFLYRYTLPVTSPVKFRVGYSL